MFNYYKLDVIPIILDVFKGMIVILLVKLLSELNVWYNPIELFIYGAAAIIGHCYSIFLDFKGGKSVASGVGTILALNFIVGVIIAVVWAIITYTTKYVSVGSIIALLISPILMFLSFFNNWII
mgnify:CR=1 FL=1